MIVELDNGIVREVDPMHSKRQAHGIVGLANYVYVCGGLSGLYLLNRCERFDVISEKWYSDLPQLNEYKFSMTICAVDNRWLYSFGGATAYYDESQRELVIERLDTFALRNHDEPGAKQYNIDNCAWELLRIRSRFQTCCQQGIIPLLETAADRDNGFRRFLIFGGVHGDYTS